MHTDDKGNDVAKDCECRQQRISQKKLKFANIPIAFKGMKLNNFGWKIYIQEDSKKLISVAVKILQKYLDNMQDNIQEGLGLYIYSLTKGSGKTRLAASLANELLEKYGYQVKFAVSTTILAELRKTYDEKNESEYTEHQLMNDLISTQILVIDDFGTENVKAWVNEKYFDLINERYLKKKLTIFTSNLPLEKLPHDNRITNRIQERSLVIKFPEESIRERIYEKNNTEYLKS